MPLKLNLEESVSSVESCLSALAQALCAHNSEQVERQAQELQRTLATAVERLALAARAGEVPPPLRQRLAIASGQMAAQRESLARATAALDRAIDVLMPPGAAHVAYSANGVAERVSRSGLAQA
jgi:plasmid stabilization system protein ParE